MTTFGNLAEVFALLEEAASRLPSGGDPQAQFDRYEMLAIQILDSEHANFPPGILEEYLNTCLYKRNLELGLISCTNDYPQNH